MDISLVGTRTDAVFATAHVVSLGDDGRVYVSATEARPCRVLCSSDTPYVLVPGDEVFVWLPNDPGVDGIILGRVGPSAAPSGRNPEEPPAELVLEARSALVLRVGDGSIEIRADGKILIKGTDLVSHAARVNRIKGGAVAIN